MRTEYNQHWMCSSFQAHYMHVTQTCLHTGKQLQCERLCAHVWLLQYTWRIKHISMWGQIRADYLGPHWNMYVLILHNVNAQHADTFTTLIPQQKHGNWFLLKTFHLPPLFMYLKASCGRENVHIYEHEEYPSIQQEHVVKRRCRCLIMSLETINLTFTPGYA